MANTQFDADRDPMVRVSELDAPYSEILRTGVDVAVSYEESSGSSYQVLPIDLSLSATAGSDDGTDPAFIAPIMGNVIGEAEVTGEGNYIAGLIGAYSIVITPAEISLPTCLTKKGGRDQNLIDLA